MSQTERLYQIVHILEDARQPVPRTHFLDTLEISHATFKRDLDYLRDRLGAPVVWRRGTAGLPSGYLLEGARSESAQRYGIRGLWFNPSEIYALLMMQHLAAAMEPGLVSGQVGALMTRVGLMLGSAADDPQEIGRRVRILHSASRRATPVCFQSVAQATMKRRRLALRYHVRSRGEDSERVVSPQQLLHYRENWYLLAWCHKADELRTFALDAIRGAEATRSKAREIGPRTLSKAVDSAFGIFAAPARERAVLRFSPEVAPWVENECWHPAQTLERLADGALQLGVPYGDPRELLMEILRYGADVEVIAPPALRTAVAERLQRAAAAYAADSLTADQPRVPSAITGA